MQKENEKLMYAFKRLIHVLTTGKNIPFEYGLTTLYRAEVHILEIIGTQSGITASDIVENMEVTKGAISQIISKLLKKELIHKSSKAGNLKILELYLTKKGKEVLLHHSEHEKGLIEKIIPELNKCRAEDVERFTAIVQAVTDFIRR